ncbi:hypothetical protein BOX30_03395 [Leptospirillum ferriphilum]|nr:hypothetical protein BOX30_03395 [Leptospirillum ferriphilum]
MHVCHPAIPIIGTQETFSFFKFSIFKFYHIILKTFFWERKENFILKKSPSSKRFILFLKEHS